MLDAGHGGKDPGCVSKDRKTYEKTLTLDICRKLAADIEREFPEVEVVMTRDSDRSISLDGRAAVANKADADLFISVHINSVPPTSPNGYSVHVLGKSSDENRDLFAYNMNVCQRENSVLKLEDDFSTKYQDFDPTDPESFIFMTLMQNAYLEQSLLFAQLVSDNLVGGPIRHGRGVWQDPFYVLWKTSMPAVLVELGFISNQDDLAVLRNEDSRQILADRLFEAFREYKQQYDRSLRTAPVSSDSASVKVPSFPTAKENVEYGVQIFVSSKLLQSTDPSFLGYEPRVRKYGSQYKYIIGVCASTAEASSHLEDIRRKYPDAFVVRLDQ